MKLEKLSLANCGGFEQIDIEFEDDITVIAGVNGVGKSTILRALAILLSRALPEFTPSKSKPISFEADDIFYGKKSLVTNLIFSYKNAKMIASVSKDKEHDSGDRFDIIPKPKSYTNPSADELRAFPLAIYFTPKRHLPGRPRSLSDIKTLDHSIAYSRALHDREIELRDIMSWFRAQERMEQHFETETFKIGVLTKLRDVITRFMPEFSNLQLQEKTENNPLTFMVEKNGKSFPIYQLSDGEKGILALVFDLTRRLVIANPRLADPIAKGRAIVLIDEVELHLHPKWQREVLRKLKNTFENCQFIVTTHSPQIIGQVRPKQLRLVVRNSEGKIGLVPTPQSFGMDSSWILEHVMGVPARDYEVEQALRRIYDDIDNGNFLDAKVKAKALEEELEGFPDLQEIFGLLDRMEMLGEL